MYTKETLVWDVGIHFLLQFSMMVILIILHRKMTEMETAMDYKFTFKTYAQCTATILSLINRPLYLYISIILSTVGTAYTLLYVSTIPEYAKALPDRPIHLLIIPAFLTVFTVAFTYHQIYKYNKLDKFFFNEVIVPLTSKIDKKFNEFNWPDKGIIVSIRSEDTHSRPDIDIQFIGYSKIRKSNVIPFNSTRN